MKIRKENDEVLYAEEALVLVSDPDLAMLKRMAEKNPRHRVRLCSHPDTSAPLHEMLIVLGKDAFVPAHKHPDKSESIHVVEGCADIVVFNDSGLVTRVIPVGAPASGKTFYCRMNTCDYHMLLIRSEFLVFHETTNGPFLSGGTVNAPWNPELSDKDACDRFVACVESSITQSPPPPQ